MGVPPFEVLVEHSLVPMGYGPLEGWKIEYVNDALCDFFEGTREDLLAGRLGFDIHPDDLAESLRLEDALARGDIDQFTVVRRYVWDDGRVKWARGFVARLPGDDPANPMCVFQTHDITAVMEAEQQLLRLASVDAVTGLHSRAWITERLASCLQDVPAGECVAVVFIDLSDYLIVNRTLGYAAGDEALSELARRIEQLLPSGHLLGRFDGHRFVLVVPSSPGERALQALARSILDAVREGVDVRGHRIARVGSAGIATSSEHSTAESLLRDADAALVGAKSQGRSRVGMVEPDQDFAPEQTLALEHDIQRGIDAGEFVIYLQRQVDLETGATHGHEALVRWLHPERGLLLPGAFMSVCEESGLCVPLGRTVLAQACRLLAERPDLPGALSVNVSAIELAEAGWLDDFRAVTADAAVDLSRLVIELTETAMLQLTQEVFASLATVRDMGVRIHVDDFGAGFASVGVLRAVHASAIKLDRAFVEPLGTGDPDLDLVRGIAGLAEGLRLDAIAEGIETQAQADIVLAAGWRVGQGYLFGRPQPPDLV